MFKCKQAIGLLLIPRWVLRWHGENKANYLKLHVIGTKFNLMLRRQNFKQSVKGLLVVFLKGSQRIKNVEMALVNRIHCLNMKLQAEHYQRILK